MPLPPMLAYSSEHAECECWQAHIVPLREPEHVSSLLCTCKPHPDPRAEVEEDRMPLVILHHSFTNVPSAACEEYGCPLVAPAQEPEPVG